MENKYYTPTIEEFHVGFEYETKEGFMDGTVKSKDDFYNAKWMPSLVSETSELAYIDRSLSGKNTKNGLCGVRVKILDREDIESLGWKPRKDGAFLFDFKDHELFLDENIIRISDMNPISYKYNSKFQGEIKNKSELHRLMKQLKIE